MLCGDCKFWGGERDVPGDDFRECTAVVHSGDCWDTQSINIMDRDPDATAVVVDGSGYFAALKTKDDFGCVLFKANASS